MVDVHSLGQRVEREELKGKEKQEQEQKHGESGTRNTIRPCITLIIRPAGAFYRFLH